MQNNKIDRIIRSRRKTLSLEVTCDARLIIRAPVKMTVKEIKRFVERKHHWVQEKQRVARERLRKLAPKQFVDGEKFLFLGNTYLLSIVDDNRNPLSFDREFRLSRAHLHRARQLFVDWYKEQAYKKIRERLHRYSSVSDIHFNNFTITNAQKRWGSCSSRGNLHFSWRLILAAPHVVDYVVVHELVHIKEQNHSAKFWKKVELLLPDYRSNRQWMKENGYLLAI